jgi:NTE family protein
MVLASTPTRLRRMPDELQERLINWGYAICDAAMRTYVLGKDHQGGPPHFPYPERGVG